MTSVSNKGWRVVAVAGTAAAALVLAGCASGGGTSSGGSSNSIVVGTTDKVTFLDPAGSFDNGSLTVQTQVFANLMNSKPGTSEVQPDLASKAEFTSPTEYTVTLKSGLKFANGDKLTASDVKFSFDRQLKINDPNGPSYLLANLASTDAPNDTTVVFHLKAGNDQVFPQVLSTSAGAIVDEQVFSADKVTPDKDIVKGEAFDGQYKIDSYDFNNLITFKANPNYAGLLGAAKTSSITQKYYTDASNLKLDVQEGNIDVAYRSLSATDVQSLSSDKKVKVVHGPGGEMRYIVFNFNTMPYGATQPGADAKKALAVRQAAADLIDRSEIASQVYKNTYTPLYSFVPDGLTGATTVLKSMYGNGKGGPDAAKAKKALTDAGITTPVALKLQYNTDHYGESSTDEYALVKSQLEAGGLFTVTLQSTEYTQYSKDRTADVYPEYQLGWFPDYADADDYLTPFFGADSFLVNHYSNQAVIDQIKKQATESDPAARKALIEDIQAKVAADLPTLPLLQGSQVAVTGTDISGTTLDGAFKFRFGTLVKG
ncbi:ABC transporter substrate-binding protein [Lysinimonas soli]|uniref:ABC transporter substrate-binding protein n=1 Tax=Lysinimonas soli TaxID=1074233 RepID=A0ABW0NRA3_9MICO